MKNTITFYNYFVASIIPFLLLLIALITTIATAPLAQNDSYTAFIIPTCLLCIIPIVYIIVIHFKRKTTISESEITSTQPRGIKKTIPLDKLQRVVHYKVAHHGNSLIFDDGTFDEFANPQELFSGKSFASANWILIAYSKSREKKLREVLPNCKFDLITENYFENSH